MRLTLFIETLRLGGAERLLATMAAHWARSHVVHLVTRPYPELDFHPLDPAVKRVLAASPRSTLGRPVELALRVRSLRRAIARTRPDVVVSFIHVNNAEALLATRGLGVPVVVSERADPIAQPLPLHHAVLRRATYPFADALVVQTEAVRAWAERFVPRERVCVIPNFVAPPPVPPPPTTEREPLIVAIGRLTPEKGFDLLLSAFGQIARSAPSWRLVILGEGPLRPSLERRIAELELGDRATLPGATRDCASYLRRAGLFVLSSRTEGFPNALLEAMAHAVPVIAADCPSGPRDIVRSDHDGLLVPVGDAPALAAAMRRLVDSPEERARLGANATAVLRRFDRDRVMSSWNRLCASLPRGREADRLWLGHEG